MKKLVFVLLIFTSISCSNDDPKPDMTTDFVGNWIADINDIDLVTRKESWKIDRIDDNTVRLIIEGKIASQSEYYPSVDYEYVVDDVKISDQKVMIIDYEETIDGILYHEKGTGILKQNSLSVAITTTNKKNGEAYSSVTNLYKK